MTSDGVRNEPGGRVDRGDTPALRSLNVLLVEDNGGDVELIKTGLAELGVSIDVEVARDGEEAMICLRRELTAAARPDLVLLDLKLPRKSGLEVVQEMKADPALQTIPVVVLTSSKAPLDMERIHALQVTGCFVKPLRGMTRLLRTIIEFVAATTPHIGLPHASGENVAPRRASVRGVRDADLAAIVRSAADAIIGVGSDGVIRNWNEAAERLYGYTQLEAVGRNIRLVIPEDRLDELRHQLDTANADAPIYLETVRVNRDGREIEVGLTVSPMRNDQGALVGHSVIARDISERRQAERRFELAVESSASAMVMVDSSGKIVLVNAEAERQFGYRREELVGAPIEQLVPVRFREQHPESRHAFESRPTTRAMGAGHELFGLRRDSTEFPVEIALNPIPTPRAHFVLASILDITERKQAERRFRWAVEASPNGIAMVDASGKILLVNAETSRMFGYQSGEMIGMPIDQLVPSRFRGQHRLHRDGFHADPQKRVMGSGRDLHGVRKDGAEFPVEIGLNPIETPDGMVVLSTIVDITERKLAERALARQTEELERSNADLEQFAYVASHDLQEPLRMITSYTDLLAANYAGRLDEKAQRFIGYAQDGAGRMQRLIDDLLAYSRVRTSRAEPHPVNSGACLQHALQNLAVAIREASAEVESGSLPPVLADETQLTEVFQNLVHNAIKFRSAERPLVRVDASVKGEMCVFRVSDNGIGVPQEQHERVFQVFQRLHTREEYPGTGIGLALCKRVVEQYGGSIGFEPSGERGTKIAFSFPVALTPKASDAPS